jgi:TonB-dependent SusC/RagA subfamily outer membrane receptor
MSKSMLKKRILPWFMIVLAALAVLAASYEDEDIQLRKINEALERFSIIYPQQKVYLHLDKQEYNGGEMMWIKAYIVNGLTHLPDTISTNLYVEVISPVKTRVEIKRFQMDHGFGIGDFNLSDTLAEGLYQVRAYTNWMQNFDEAFFFQQNFPLSNPSYSRLISPKEARNNKKEIHNLDKKSKEIDLQFMPEGGVLVNGLESTVGFKAVNELGKGMDLKGSIVDETGKEITEFSSFNKGMGRFILTPQKGKKYFAISGTGSEQVKVALPAAMETGLVMHVENESGTISITLQKSKPLSGDRSANDVVLVGQIGGKLYFNRRIQMQETQKSIRIEKGIFPSGIMQITAFSGRGMPLAERLVFINRLDDMKIGLTATDTLVNDIKKIRLEVKVTDKEERPLQANLSLAVTREKTTSLPVSSDNIVSHLLLTSDLTGYVEDPGEYFTDHSPVHQQGLDNIMLINGWRRFDWAKILAGEFPKIEYHEERGIAVYGQITLDFFNIALKNCKVQMTILNSFNDVFTQYTNDKGYFLFDNLVYYDTVSVKIEAWRQSGRRNLQILLPDEKPNEVNKFQGDFSLITYSNRDNKAYRIERYEETKQAMIKAREEEKNENKLHDIYSEPDFVLHSEDFPKGSRSVLDVMKGRIPGVNIYGNQIVIRGPNSLMGSNQPLFLIDGVPTRDVESINSIPVDEIDRIEVLKGPSSAIYGMRGANGVIAIYTKRGEFMKRGVIEFSMLGYNTPRKFYQPRYMPENEPPSNYTVFWEPVIITDENGTASVLMDKPSINGDYRFIIEGISYMGHVGSLNEIVDNEQ